MFIPSEYGNLNKTLRCYSFVSPEKVIFWRAKITCFLMPLLTRRSVALVVFTLCLFASAHSQSYCPPNLDFEAGDLTNWECFVGFTDTIAGKNRMTLQPSAPLPNRHEVISAASNPGNDPYGDFPKICPYGGNYSVKLGNSNTNAEAESISYTFTMPATIDTFTFTYFYAVVFEDPQHTAPEQPRFFVTAYDVETGALINCASYDYVSTAALPGFQKSAANPQVLFKDWTPTSLQFAGMGGHKVRLEFRTADCTRGGHFGYAYMDVASACSNILATAPYCIETNSLILNAPFGFQTYTWYNEDFSKVMGSGQTFTLSPPPATSGLFYVDVEPYPGFGCRDTLQAFVKPLPVPAIPEADALITLCQYQSSLPLSAKVLPGNQLLWYTSPSGGIGTTSAPRPPTSTTGVFKYYVSQKALFGCEGFRKEITVRVIPTPIPSFTINSTRQCLNGNNFVFSSTSGNLSDPVYTWDFGNGKTFSSSDTFSVYNYTTAGNYTVRLKTSNLKTCSADISYPVTVIPKPVASFTYPPIICENQTPVVLTDRSSVPGNISTISNWWWDINGKTMQVQAPSQFTAPAGQVPVKLVVTTNEGCISDTNTTVLNSRYAPLAAFTIGDLFCNNESIHFTDHSTVPASTTQETITKWTWVFDNSMTAIIQNPSTVFNVGKHAARLTSETSVGCKSVPIDQPFEIFPKPLVQLDINDSCVFVPITYSATDLSGNVIKYNWDLGNGFKTGGSSMSMTFNNEGSRPFTLMTYTEKGCRDTIYRPFFIYDNKSFAGRDTVAAIGEPVQLDARGEANMQYAWSPSVGLDHSDIEKPVATLDRDQRYELKTVTEKGCRKESQIMIKRYVGPELYVPTAFSPNNDGLNDRFKVVPVGIRSFGYLAVYNRWGQLMYRTTNYNEGWDGTFKGIKQAAGTFVFVVEAVDYKGKKLFRKGTVTLLR
jgi:gliding motility-associated-like protein